MPNAPSQFLPITVSEDDIGLWPDRLPIAFRFAFWWARAMPRGKGWVPRNIGRLLCKNMKVSVRTRHGGWLAVAPSSLDVYAFILCNGGSWAPNLLRICRQFLSAGDTFYDIGSNVGYFSIELSSLFNGLRVVAFEPQPDLAQILATSAVLNGYKDISVYDLMLGREVGFADLYIPSHSIHASLVSREEGAHKLRRQVCTLDQLVQSHAIPPPEFIKIDVEGGELDVFSGATTTIRDYSPYILFEADENMTRFGYGRGDLIRVLSGLAPYEFFFATAAGFRPVDEDNMNSAQYTDVMAIPTRLIVDCRQKGII